MTHYLNATSVTKIYQTGDVRFTALDNVTLSIEKGEFVAIVGPSGCGKSTLLHMMGGLDRPDSGEVTLEGRSLSNLDESESTLLRRRQIGFVFQKVLLLPMLRALDNVMVPLRLDGVSVEEAIKRAQDALKSVDMLHKSSSRPGELSGGEAQRVAIARAMVINPAIILADEPTGALDSQNSKNIIELFRDLVTRSQQTLIVVTHDPSVAAAADRTVRMKDGEIIEDQRNAKVAV